jgi:Carboxypeptidase regulatory-like domain
MSHDCRARPVAFFLLAFTPAVGGGHAVAQVGTAALTGEVHDQQRAAIPGATVTLVDVGTRAERVMMTDRTGTYRFLALLPGTYSLKVELQGFAPAARDQVVAAVSCAWAGRLLRTTPTPSDNGRFC